MKLSFHQLQNPVKNLDGKPVPYSIIDNESTHPLTLAQCMRHALTAGIRGDKQEGEIGDDQAFKDYDLAKEILNCPEDGQVEILSAMCSRIQTLARKVFGKEVGGYMRDVLEQKIELVGANPVGATNGVSTLGKVNV